MVVLNSYDVIKEAYVQNGDSASGRIQFDHLKITGDYDAGSECYISLFPSFNNDQYLCLS